METKEGQKGTKAKMKIIMRMSFFSYRILTAVFVLGSLSGHAQSGVIPPSPNAAAFAKYGNIPISTYTGVPDISIPIYQIKVRDITVPISLSYHASGIKVGEEASRVGLGWVLNAGGVISRNVVNKDDFLADVTAYLNAQNNSPVLPTGPAFVPNKNVTGGTTITFIDTQNIPATTVLDLANHIYGSTVDYEPDQFNYNFLGNSGKFVLDRNRQPILEKQEKIKITPNADGSSWDVRTPDGFKYVFAASESFTDMGPGGSEQKSAWYLTEINSPQGEKVTFHYETLGSQFIKPVGNFSETVQAYQFSCGTFACTPVPNSQTALPRKKYSNIYLSHIRWPHGKVEFVLSDRDDIEGDKKIDVVKVYSNKKALPAEDYVQVEEYRLGYSYFDYNVGGNTFPMPDVTDARLRKRLKLVSMSKHAATVNTPKEHEYLFNYYETANSDQLPAKNSYSRDHWGYSNGKGNISLIPTFNSVVNPSSYDEISGIMGTERNPSAEHMRAYSLKEIVYPTKGKTTFYYGVNDYEVTMTSEPEVYPLWENVFYDAVADRGVVKTQVMDFRDGYASTSNGVIPVEVNVTFRANPTCGQLLGAPDIYFEVLSFDDQTSYGRVSMGMTPCTGPNQIDCIYCVPEQTSFGVYTYRGLLSLHPGKYKWKAFVNGQETQFQNISGSYKWWVDARKRSPLGANKKYALTGGLRIERIEDSDPESNVSNVRKFEYHYTTDVDANGIFEEHSYGRRMVQPKYSYFDVAWEKKCLNPESPPAQRVYSTCTDCAYMLRQSDSFLPATGTQGNIVGYDKVTEIIGVNGENGRTEYQYENVEDAVLVALYPHGGNSYRIRPASISTKAHPLNGLLKAKASFTASGLPVHQITNTYRLKYNKIVYGLEYRKVRTVGFDWTDYATIYQLLGNNADVLMNVYPATISNFQFLETSTETTFDAVGALQLSVETTHSYDNQNHLQLTKATRTRSDGHKLVTTYKYPGDYSDGEGGTTIAMMKGDDVYMHNSPIEVTISNEEPGGSQKILSRNITVYDVFNGKVRPKENVALQKNAPVLPDQLPDYIPSAGYGLAHYRKILSMDYTPEWNLDKVEKTSDLPLSYVWGHKKTLPVAEVKNAISTEILYEGFEDTSAAGVIDNSNLSHTGGKYYSGDYTVSFTLPNTRTYLIEYWYLDATNKWQYISKTYAGPSMVLSEGSAIDDVRIYPKDAQMKSYTYEPLWGMTSSIDENGQTYRYEYDSFGRLFRVLNEKGSIEKQFTYHYRDN